MIALQAIRVAEVMNTATELLVRGKCPPERVATYVEKARIPLLATDKGIFETCELLYSRGLRPTEFHRVSKFAGWMGSAPLPAGLFRIRGAIAGAGTVSTRLHRILVARRGAEGGAPSGDHLFRGRDQYRYEGEVDRPVGAG